MSVLQGAFNFRDLGGLRTHDGRRVRTGRVFRSDTLQALTAEDVRLLRDTLQLRGIVDLRLEREVQEEGRGLLGDCPDIRFANSPLNMAATEGVAPDRVMPELYLGCLVPGDALISALQQLSEMADEPVVFHCAAGKDRTGVLAAVLLRLLGVTDDDIVADFMKSALPMPKMVERFSTWPRYREHMANTPPQAYAVEQAPLRELLDRLDTEHGGVIAWAQERGLSKQSILRLSEMWLE